MSKNGTIAPARGFGFGRDVLTTGQVARICRVSPRTASKWFDSGEIKGYRIPGSQDRRIPHASLVDFLRRHGMESLLAGLPPALPVLVLAGVDAPLAGRTAAMLEGRATCRRVEGLFDLGLEASASPDALVLDCSLGTREVLALAARLADPARRVVVLLPEDAPAAAAVPGVVLLRHPAAAGDVARAACGRAEP